MTYLRRSCKREAENYTSTVKNNVSSPFLKATVRKNSLCK